MRAADPRNFATLILLVSIRRQAATGGGVTIDISSTGAAHDALQRGSSVRSSTDRLRILVIGAGLCWAVTFVVVGVRYDLQMYGDGSIFSYAVAVRDAWGFHWHNIPDRLFVYLLSILPAESYIGLTDDTHGGIALYGCLFFIAPLLALASTLAADRSNGKIIFSFACFSTAVLCPLTFGFPTEMWVTHALFWPTLAVCHFARHGIAANLLRVAILAALALTHEGALILELVILGTLALRGTRDKAFLSTAAALLPVFALWLVVKETFPPDDYIVGVMAEAAWHFFDLSRLVSPLTLLLLSTLAGYAAIAFVLQRRRPATAHVYAAAAVAVALAIYWLWLDDAIHASNRYYFRTVLFIATSALGTLAAVCVLATDAVPGSHRLSRVVTALTSDLAVRAVTGAFVLVMLVHAVETAKFVTSWTQYQAAVRVLAQGGSSDPMLGDARFVSSDRITAATLKRLSWNSTTPFLSVLVAPGFAPKHLVVNPRANYFWLACESATANAQSDRAIPLESRRLIRVHACLHR
jgi:hypothetical protein